MEFFHAEGAGNPKNRAAKPKEGRQPPLVGFLRHGQPYVYDVQNYRERPQYHPLAFWLHFPHPIGLDEAHTHVNSPHVTIESSNTILQWSEGGAGYCAAAAAARDAWVGAGAAAGTGIFPITCETGTQSFRASLRHRSVSRTFPDAT